ncbi:MAG: hypothetical protein ACJ71A_13760, partial [Nitrososphaeraceae archaeon]
KYVLTLAFVATASVLIATILEFSYQAKALEYQSSTTCINGKCHTDVYNSNDISVPDYDNETD